MKKTNERSCGALLALQLVGNGTSAVANKKDFAPFLRGQGG